MKNMILCDQIILITEVRAENKEVYLKPSAKKNLDSLQVTFFVRFDCSLYSNKKRCTWYRGREDRNKEKSVSFYRNQSKQTVI
jgi:hypothetical protein